MKLVTLLALALTLTACGKDDGSSVSYSRFEENNQRTTDDDAVTNEYGALKVREGEYTFESEVTPWSSWWFPMRDRFLFDRNDSKAPLVKYDEYVSRRHSIDARAANYEEQELYNPAQAAWAGLCHAWAVASILHREPTRILRKENITFDVADQKALLLKSYENVGNLKIYGDRFDGQHDDNYDDIFPDQFHRFVQVHLEDMKKPFMMDYDASYPVWTVPVFKAKFSITFVSPTVADVKAWVTFASPLVDAQYVGTRDLVKTYTYRLYGNTEGGVFTAIDSEWTGASVHDHPDYVIAYPEGATRGSYNREIDIEMVDEILK